PNLELMLEKPGGSVVAWPSLAAPIRERLALALRLRLAEAALKQGSRGAAPAEPRVIVLSDRPDGFRDDAKLVAFVASIVPQITQIVVEPGVRLSRNSLPTLSTVPVLTEEAPLTTELTGPPTVPGGSQTSSPTA